MIAHPKHRVRDWVVLAILVLLVVLLLSSSSGGTGAAALDHLSFPVPAPLKAEHAELHAQLRAATEAGGKTGEAAREVERLLHPHFLKEEEFALPPLAALPALARGETPDGLPELLRLTEKMKAQLPQMLEEHQLIVAALGRLSAAARRENWPDVIEFAEKLVLHAQSEEQILYPAAVLVGEYCKAKGWP